MAKKTNTAQIAFSFDEDTPKSKRDFGSWRYPGDPDTPEGKAMPNRCQKTFPELGGLPCLMKTMEKYCVTCEAQFGANRG